MSPNTPASVVLLSSGLDSTVNLYEAARSSRVVLALTFDYGQRAALRELERSEALARAVGVPWKSLDLTWFSEFTKTSLVNKAADVPTGASVSIDDLKQSGETAKAVWVPNRNGIFLNIAAAFAEGLGATQIIPGFNIEEGATFPDNTQEFLNAATAAFAYSTSNHVKAVCYTTALDKTQIVGRGRELGARFDLMWPCYFAGGTACGECESCKRFARATSAAGVQVAGFGVGSAQASGVQSSVGSAVATDAQSGAGNAVSSGARPGDGGMS